VQQTDPAEYATAEEARRWGGSSCSAASLCAVLRSAGKNIKVGDVVRVLEGAGGITVAQGLVSRPALVATARKFGLAAEDRAIPYEQLAIAAREHPVLVDITNAKFPQGHWLVVAGADASGVDIVDSSGYRLTHMTRGDFQAAWSGRAVLLSPSPRSPNVAALEARLA
jgi:ABC-type bacteriocin/lantibiotic exporter with double-glycine peptidase domain